MKRSEIKEQLQKISRDNYKEMLERHGFFSYRGEDLNWYKLENEVLYCVHLLTYFAHPPMLLWLYYGAHPLFLETKIGPGYIGMNMYAEAECYTRWTFPIEGKRFAFIATATTDIATPALPACGALQMEDNILRLFDTIRSGYDAYLWHKQEELERLKSVPSLLTGTYNMSGSLIDEVLYYKDEELYPLCKHGLSCKLQHPSAEIKERAELQLAVLKGDRREEFEALMEERKINLLQELHRKVPELRDRIDQIRADLN